MYLQIKCPTLDVFKRAATVKGHMRCTFEDEANCIRISWTSGKKRASRAGSSLNQLIGCWDGNFLPPCWVFFVFFAQRFVVSAGMGLQPGPLVMFIDWSFCH